MENSLDSIVGLSQDPESCNFIINVLHAAMEYGVKYNILTHFAESKDVEETTKWAQEEYNQDGCEGFWFDQNAPMPFEHCGLNTSTPATVTTVNQKFRVRGKGKIYTVESFFGSTGVSYDTLIEAIEENPKNNRIIAVSNIEDGGATDVADCILYTKNSK